MRIEDARNAVWEREEKKSWNEKKRTSNSIALVIEESTINLYILSRMCDQIDEKNDNKDYNLEWRAIHRMT